MICETIHLKERFPFLGDEARDPTVEIFLPFNMPEKDLGLRKRPGLVIVPGGAYRFCSQREAEPIGLNFLGEGFDVFILNYSIAPHRFPAQMQELAAVMELAHERAEAWNLDVQKIAVMGFSAGGHLAAQYVNSYDMPQVRAVFPESKGAAACVLGYPVISIEAGELPSFRNLLGYDTFTQADYDCFDCERLVTGRTPPTFLWATAEDQRVSIEHTLCYASALHRSSVPLELHIYPHGRHGLSTVDYVTNTELDAGSAIAREWIPAACRWLRETLQIFR